MKWNIPELQKLWFGKEQIDNLNRMKAFLTCMQSDTQHITKTTMVPQRLIIMCCVLRYSFDIIQDDLFCHVVDIEHTSASTREAQEAPSCVARHFAHK